MVCIILINIGDYEIFDETHMATPPVTSTIPAIVQCDIGSPSNLPNSVVNKKVRELVIGTASVMSAVAMVM